MDKTARSRRSQAQRREASRQAVLESACRLFGERGYAGTSLEDIAADCGLTIRPIYHYFGNKLALFTAVNERMEQRIVRSMMEHPEGAGIQENWRAFLALCEDPAFRQVVLIDSPGVLGRERWIGSAVGRRARKLLDNDHSSDPARVYRSALLNRVVMAAFAEAALMVSECTDTDMARRETELLMVALFSRLRGHLSVPAEGDDTV